MSRHIADLSAEELAAFIDNQRAMASDYESMAHQHASLADEAETELQQRKEQGK